MYLVENKENISRRNKKYYYDNKEKLKVTNSKWRSRNKDKLQGQQREYYLRNKTKLDLYSLHRKLYIKQATPKWANIEAIEHIYNSRDVLTESTGIEHHVDHIVPLRGKLVCGLHCEDNLRVITKSENKKKSNKWTV